MRKHKRKFEDYEEIALCLRTAKQLLYRTEVIIYTIIQMNQHIKKCSN